MRFVLQPDPHPARFNAIQAVKNAPIGYVVSIEEPKKSDDQRKLFHSLCAEIGGEIGMHAGDVKEIAKAKLLGWREVGFGGLKLVVADGRSETLSKKQYSELIDIVYELAAEAGVILK